MPTKKPRVIRASEIGSYVYCRRAWWLKRVAGFEPEGRDRAFAEGIAAHARHGHRVQQAHWQRRLALSLLVVGLLLVGLALLNFKL